MISLIYLPILYHNSPVRAIIFLQFSGFILDKVIIVMVKYAQVNIAVNGKSTIVNPNRESGSSAASPGGVGGGKVRPGASRFLSEK